MKTIRDVEMALQPYFEASTMPGVGANFRLEKTLELAQRVGNPQQRVKVVHVAGTSGKTSTVYYTAALLAEAGLKVGMTVSPHVTSVAERVQILDSSFDEATFARYFSEYLPLATANGTLVPSFHDLMMVFALWVFDRENVDYAVLETGMGGMYDSSNICRREDKLCVITDIGFDHVAILGDTLGKIAEQKAGIIAEKNIVCMYKQSDEVMESVRAAAEKYHATVVLADERPGGTYFDRNFQLATTVYGQIAARDGLPVLSDEQLRAARVTSIPGRLEAFELGGATFILDGAHNEQKLRAMFATLDATYGAKKWPIILALKHDKVTDGVVELVVAHASKLTTSEYAMSQDMPFLPTPAYELAELFAGKIAQVQIEPDLPTTLQQAIDGGGETHVLVTGSFYAVSEARKWLLEHGAAVQ